MTLSCCDVSCVGLASFSAILVQALHDIEVTRESSARHSVTATSPTPILVQEVHHIQVSARSCVIHRLDRAYFRSILVQETHHVEVTTSGCAIHCLSRASPELCVHPCREWNLQVSETCHIFDSFGCAPI
ncbi:TPA: hypothetical protein N0F65_004583 [Lagenidium giganteum]|uniref:Secreted protein n=1 Tax=Lagenidium giganteum TaxID=4803 RepID=A0AAV2ZAD4_9STRA|nr:TPA: hypothetical protein N0F65_004583 [Lagenidium giganteum]